MLRVLAPMALALLGLTSEALADCTNYSFATGRGPLTGLQGVDGAGAPRVLDPPALAASSEAGALQDYAYFYQVEPSYAYVPANSPACPSNTRGRVVFGYIDADSRRRRAKATGVLRSTVAEWVSHDAIGFTVFANTTSQLGPGETWDGATRTHLDAHMIIPSFKVGACVSTGP